MRTILLLLIILLTTRLALAQQSPTPTITAAESTTPMVTKTETPSRTPTPIPTTPPTPAPTLEGFAMDGAAEVMFPEAIRFQFSLSRALSDLDTDTLRLTLNVADAEPLELALQMDDLTVSGAGHTHFEYIWDVPDDAFPPLFSQIDYGWQIQALDGETAALEGSLIFTDPRVVWITSTEADGGLTVTAAREVPTGLVRGLGSIYALLAETSGAAPDVKLMIYGESVSPGCLVRQTENGRDETVAVALVSGVAVDCRPEFAERVYRDSGYTVMQRLPDADVEGQAAAVMMRAFYQPLWQGADVPRWFAAGLEQLYAPALKSDLLPTALNAVRTNRLFTLAAMDAAPPDDAVRAQIWMAQSYGMVLYMVELGGLEGVYRLARSLGSGEPFADSYAELTGEPLDSLIPSWQGWIFGERARSVYGITPYQPATPTATRTQTPLPTRTETPTPTLTPSVTPSVTGVLSLTPYPTITMPPTPTPEPPTVTPRPPILTPTPAADSTNTLLETPGAQAGLVVVALLLIGVLVVISSRMGRR